jgi:hypothetical protein
MDNSTETELRPPSISVGTFVVGLFLALSLGFMSGTGLGFSAAGAQWRQKAVQAGCGEYVITDVMTGKTEFQFKGGK